ncbi:hypothetical protein GO491_03535 [Flavobacteriaceae bacterium Ap0902]|nr:hypothetical protein [Flavobacteriaceae bacterium Ap0902]
MMKYIILFNILFIFGFGKPKNIMVENSRDCPLNMMNRTVNYKKEIAKFASLKKDSIISLETVQINDTKYTTVLDFKDNENLVWLLIENQTKGDSILLHYSDYVEYLQEVNTRFDLEKCQLIIETIYFTGEERDCKSIDRIKL